jgi:hypothetical protein
MFKEKRLLENFFEKRASRQAKKLRILCQIYDRRILKGDVFLHLFSVPTKEDIWFAIAVKNIR